MIWIIIAAVGLAIVFILFGLSPMQVPRRYGHEGPETTRSVRDFDRVGRWFLFVVQRKMIMGGMPEMSPDGFLTDIGCGSGHLTAEVALKYPYMKVAGLDFDNRMLELARKNWPAPSNGLNFILGDAQNLPFGDNTLDCLVSSLSLHHWKDAPAVFLELHRVLKPGGRLLIWDLRRDAPRFFYYILMFGQAFLAPRSIRQINGAIGSFWASYTSPELKTMLQRASFTEIEVQPGFGWTLTHAAKPDQAHFNKAAPAVIPGPTATTRP